MNKFIYISAICILLLVAVFSGSKIYAHFEEAKKQEDLYESLVQIVEMAEAQTEAEAEEEETAPSVPMEDEELVMLPEYAALYEQNNDLVGWIRIEDTRINYPVMQSPGRPNYYLDHGFDKSETAYGCPYVPRICDVNEPSDNVIIYGHHKKNGTMFTDLKKFQKKSFWETHKTFSFDTLYEKQTYEIVVVFKTVVYTNSKSEFKYYQFADAETPEAFAAYLAECKKRALYDTGVTAEYGDKLITLSTCEYSRKNGRLVVVAKRVEE